MNTPRGKIGLFLALTMLLSAVCWVPIIRSGDLMAGGGKWVLALMWCPGIAAILTRLATQRDLSGMGWKPGPPRYLLLAWLLPLAYALPVYAVAWGGGLGGVDPSRWAVAAGTSPWVGLLVAATVGVAMGLVSATGEEIGWRGLLVPEMARLMRREKVALVSGLIWAAWHMPVMIGANYHGAGTPLAYSLGCFTAMVVAMSFLMAWIRLRSHSLWPAAILHAAHNLFVQSVFDKATLPNESTPWWTGEFGLGLVLTIGLAAFVLTRRSTAAA